MTFKELIPHLKDTPCKEAVEWTGDRNLHECWNTCERGDWMIWFIDNSNNEVTDRELRLIAVKCARRVQHLMTDERSIVALNVAERYANGQATDEELTAARAAAWQVAWDPEREVAWSSASVAATDAAKAAASDPASDAAWGAARAAARGDVRGDENRAQADIIREIIPQIKIII